MYGAGATAAFVRCVSGKGWLPVTNPDVRACLEQPSRVNCYVLQGTKVCLKILGSVTEIDLGQSSFLDIEDLQKDPVQNALMQSNLAGPAGTEAQLREVLSNV